MVEILDNLRSKAEKKLEDNIGQANSFKELEEKLEKRALVKVPFCSIDWDGEACTQEIKEKLKADVRGESFEKEKARGKCIICNKKAKHLVYIARSY